MFEIDNLLKEVIVIYFSFSILLYQLKLDIMFDENENFIPFGVSKGVLMPHGGVGCVHGHWRHGCS